jgi:hypothetical protein
MQSELRHSKKKNDDAEEATSPRQETKGKAKLLPEGSGGSTGVKCATCASNGDEVWVIPGRSCAYCRTRTRPPEDPKLAESYEAGLEIEADKPFPVWSRSTWIEGPEAMKMSASAHAELDESIKRKTADDAKTLENVAKMVANTKKKMDEGKAPPTAGGK